MTKYWSCVTSGTSFCNIVPQPSHQRGDWPWQCCHPQVFCMVYLQKHIYENHVIYESCRVWFCFFCFVFVFVVVVFLVFFGFFVFVFQIPTLESYKYCTTKKYWHLMLWSLSSFQLMIRPLWEVLKCRFRKITSSLNAVPCSPAENYTYTYTIGSLHHWRTIASRASGA